MKSGQIFFFSLNRGNGLNGRGGKEAIGFDEIVSQFEPDDPKGMVGPVIIIEISIRIDEGGFQIDPLGSFKQFPTQASKTTIQLYLDIGYFSRFLQNLLEEKIGLTEKTFPAKRFCPSRPPLEGFGRQVRFLSLTLY